MNNSIPQPTPEQMRELRKLVATMLDDSLAKDDWGRLQELVASNNICSQYYLSQIHLHTELAHKQRREDDDENQLLKSIQAHITQESEEPNRTLSGPEANTDEPPETKNGVSKRKEATSGTSNVQGNGNGEYLNGTSGKLSAKNRLGGSPQFTILKVSDEAELNNLVTAAMESENAPTVPPVLGNRTSEKRRAEEKITDLPKLASRYLIVPSFEKFGLITQAAIGSIAVLLMFTVVLGSGVILTFMRDVLVPPRTTEAASTGGLIAEREDRLQFITGPNQENGTRRIGSSSFSGVALVNVFAFPLPAMENKDQIHQAQLEWTYRFKQGDPNFSVDLYGLGFVKPGNVNGKGFWEGGLDSSLRSAYGMEGSQSRRVTLLANDVMTPDTKLGEISVDNSQLSRFLQTLYDDGAKEGDLVVFRLNSNKSTSHIRRRTGYAVVHPPIIPRLSSHSSMPKLHVSAKRSVDVKKYSEVKSSLLAQGISADFRSGITISDGTRIRPGGNVDGLRRVGSAMHGKHSLANVLMFTLPHLSVNEEIEFASIEWQYHSKNGAPDFSVDLYGLGYATEDDFHASCFWEGERDYAIAEDYGLLGPKDQPVALIANGVITPHTDTGKILIDGNYLSEFLRSLYRNGAKGGDLIVFRLNADANIRGITRSTGYMITQPPSIEGKTSKDNLPVLRVTTKTH